MSDHHDFNLQSGMINIYYGLAGEPIAHLIPNLNAVPQQTPGRGIHTALSVTPFYFPSNLLYVFINYSF